MPLTTRLDAERHAQQQWRPRNPERVNSMVEILLQTEYMEPTQAQELEANRLARLLTFAREQVPFYQQNDRWREAIFEDSKSGRELLEQLPILSKYELQESYQALKAGQTPPEYKGRHQTISSGTTGRPTAVLFSGPAFQTFGLLLQRQLRWDRVDPTWTMATIRLSRDIPSDADGALLADGETYRANGWMYLNGKFDTGPMVAFNRSNSVEAQIEWLRRERPEYLVTFPGTLETLVYACQGTPVDSLRAVRTISATLTEGMRQRIESATGLKIQQNYGFNEIGLVANRCIAGRYHVNSEYCVVEIVDDAGKPSKVGETGRILVTALTNLAMPLVRYDSGDLAVAVEGPCSCGRTLPSFGRVIGRYRAMQYAPPGTSQRVNLVSATIDKLPLSLLSGLREYQLHQYHDGSFDLRLVTRGEPEAQLLLALREAWERKFDDATPLRILPVDSLPPAPGGKQQEFSSDFFPSVNEGVSTTAQTD